ncbi:hypothetical protein PHYSODRAFT_306840 [Phytophthora sojae]|uniref:SF3 helicase domain-containing protein n=1 Tax=Phytophthora sojae (strain P6497) TaxID=1094619 RepID=G5ACW1_PHYSP|nr:hypothetical protein PHYSODRAFT_306840 [Phytophthora sojae]EGZ06623.1 hypothetical protein PHYSODRAFT_306840 [Phytophthora sojae]|eukprot:XP_009537387.1 hypothetical protein PHYSODRAFT_306840 [Phytophthora sojae]
MCNFIKANGEQCKLARNKDRCGKHQIIAVEQNNLEVTRRGEVSKVPELDQSIVEPVIAEGVVYKEDQSSDLELINSIDADVKPTTEQLRKWAFLIVDANYHENRDRVEAEKLVLDSQQIDFLRKYVEANTKKNAKGKDIESILNRDSNVIDRFERKMKERKMKEREMNERNDEDEFFFENYIEEGRAFQYDVKENLLDATAIIGAFDEYINGKGLDIADSEKTDRRAYLDGYRYCFYIQQGNMTLIHYYCKTEQMMKNIPIMIGEINVAQYCVANKLYDQRLYKLCCMMKRSWFSDNNNTWNLAGVLYRKQHVDLGLMRKTYLCILYSMTDRFDQAAALKVFNDWETSKYHPNLTESQIKSIGGGTDPDGYKEWKAEYEPQEVKEKKEGKEKKTPLDILKEKLIDIVKDKYKREFQSGAIYENMLPYYYVRKYDDPATFLNVVFATEPLFHMCKSQDHQQLLYFIKNIINPNFEFIKLDYNYIGFKNGIYDLSNATFIMTADIVENIQVRTYIDSEFEIDNDYAPVLDQYLKFQFDDETIEFIYFMIGRLMTKLNDKFDFMVFLFGEGGSGKSLLMNLVKYSFAHDQVGILSNSHQEQFGLSEYAKKQILCCDDMNNLAKTLPKADFLSMGTRGSVQCPVKGKGSIPVHDWDIPTIINSNKLPNYKDESGEVVRRFMVANFEKIIPEESRNTNLENEIKTQEFGVFLHRCRSTYLKFCSKYKNKGVETFCPVSFIDNRNLLRMATNNTYQFISEK